jgi:hypothetical protein
VFVFDFIEDLLLTLSSLPFFTIHIPFSVTIQNPFARIMLSNEAPIYNKSVSFSEKKLCIAAGLATTTEKP